MWDDPTCLKILAAHQPGPSDQCPVDKPMCYKLTEAAIQAGHIRNLSNPKVGESAKSGTLE